jgi:cytochrome c
LKIVFISLAAVWLVTAAGEAVAQDDAGAKLFKNHCGTCHTLVDDGRNRQGPLLLGLFKRKSGTQEKYTKYSQGLKDAAWQWTPEQLDLWLTDPKALVPTTFMSAYKQKDPEKRKLIIDYIKANGGM